MHAATLRRHERTVFGILDVNKGFLEERHSLALLILFVFVFWSYRGTQKIGETKKHKHDFNIKIELFNQILTGKENEEKNPDFNVISIMPRSKIFLFQI